MTYKEKLIEWTKKEVEKGLVDIKLFQRAEVNISFPVSPEKEEELCKEVWDIIHAPTVPLPNDL